MSHKAELHVRTSLSLPLYPCLSRATRQQSFIEVTERAKLQIKLENKNANSKWEKPTNKIWEGSANLSRDRMKATAECAATDDKERERGREKRKVK